MQITKDNLLAIPGMYPQRYPAKADISPSDVATFLEPYSNRVFIAYTDEASELEDICHMLRTYYDYHQPCMSTSDLQKLTALTRTLSALRLRERDKA